MNGEAVQMNSQNSKAHKKKTITKVLCFYYGDGRAVGIRISGTARL